MEKNCKSCFKYSECDLTKFLPFPQFGCSEFENKPKFLYGILLRNGDTGKKSVLNIHDDFNLATAELHHLSENLCKRPSSHLSVYIRHYLYPQAKVLADEILLSIVNNVAQDLLIAERGFKKGCFKKETFEKSKRWFDFAHAACRRGAAILDIILDD